MALPEIYARQLLDRSGGSLEGVVEAICGINAQTPRAPAVALWTRLEQFDPAELDALLAERRLVRANLFRGTVHLVTARQFRAWREALQPALSRTVKQFQPRLWDHADEAELVARGEAVLAERPGLTRGELGDALAPHFPGAEPGGLGFAARLLCRVVQVPGDVSWDWGRTRYELAADHVPGRPGEAAAGLAELLDAARSAFAIDAAADATYLTGLTGLAKPFAAASDPGQETTPRASALLPEYDNAWFCRKSGPGAEPRRQLIKNTATVMSGGVVRGGEIVGEWRHPTAKAPLVLEWRGEPTRADLAEERRFRAFYAATFG